MSKTAKVPPSPSEPESIPSEKWRTLAGQAAQEQDTHKLLTLVSELCSALDEREVELRNPYYLYRQRAAFQDLLQSTIEATGADFGNVQLLDTVDDTLKIITAQGFDAGFLDFFENVSANEGCACGAALKDHARIVITDVAQDPIFSRDSREVLEHSSVRSLQSTPLVSPNGKLIGVISTHYRRLNGPNNGMWQSVDELVERCIKQIGNRGMLGIT